MERKHFDEIMNILSLECDSFDCEYCPYNLYNNCKQIFADDVIDVFTKCEVGNHESKK